MILFWLIAAIFVAIALAFLLPPLLERSGKDEDKQSKQEANIDVYRDQLSELEADLRNGIISQEQYQQDRDEIERRLLDDVSVADKVSDNISGKVSENESKQVAAGRAPIFAIAFGIPIIAVTMYLLIGNPAALSPGTMTNAAMSNGAPVQAPFAAGSQGQGPMTQQQIQQNVAALAKRLEQNPGDLQGWIMLGRSYATVEKYTEASNAYAKAAALKPDDPDLLTDYAFTLAMANGRALQGEPAALIQKALALDPENLKALELAGNAEFQAKNYAKAITYWQKVLDKAPAGSELAQALAGRIDEAKSLATQSAK